MDLENNPNNQGTRIGGEYVVVVYGNSDNDDAVVIYASGDVTTWKSDTT